MALIDAIERSQNVCFVQLDRVFGDVKLFVTDKVKNQHT